MADWIDYPSTTDHMLLGLIRTGEHRYNRMPDWQAREKAALIDVLRKLYAERDRRGLDK